MTENAKPGGNAFEAWDALASAAASSSVEPSADLRARLLASRTRTGRYGIFVDRIARLFDLGMKEAEELLASLERPETWRPFFVDGTAVVAVKTGPKRASTIATMVKVDPGVEFPKHLHRGVETMLVVDGGFKEPGREGDTWRGEEITRQDGTEHSLVGLPGIPCVAAVLIEGHADFT